MAKSKKVIFLVFGNLTAICIHILENNLLVQIENDKEIGMSAGSLDDVRKSNGRKSER